MLYNLTENWDRTNFLKQNADMIDQGLLLCSNTVILARALFRSIPRQFATAARTLNSFTGVISIHFQFQELFKVEKDFSLALANLDLSSLLYTAVRTALKATDIFLTLGSFAVYSLALSGFPGITPLYYNAVTPVAVTSWMTMIAFDIIDFIYNRKLVEELNNITENEQQNKLAQEFDRIAFHDDYTQSDPLARRILRQLDPYRLDSLKKEGVTFHALQNNLKTAIILNDASIFLKIFGYVCLGINRMYPETLIQALTAWLTSLLYALKLAYAKYQ